MKHQLFFIREDRPFNLFDQLLVLEVETISPDADPLQCLKNAVTQWVNETDEGKECWEDSSEDLNIGDLLCYGGDAFTEFLKPNGIVGITTLVQASDSNVIPYDTILAEVQETT